jgi:hypothetical protein
LSYASAAATAVTHAGGAGIDRIQELFAASAPASVMQREKRLSPSVGSLP